MLLEIKSVSRNGILSKFLRQTSGDSPIPYCIDRNSAPVLDRSMIVESSNPLKDEEKDPSFKELLGKEREAFLLFMLYCYKQLKDRSFRLKKQDKETLAQMLLESYYKDIESFAEEEIELDPNLKIEKGEAYKLYADWCVRKGKKPMGRNSFYEKFEQWLKNKYREMEVFVEKALVKGPSGKHYFACGRRGEKANGSLSDFANREGGGAEGQGPSESKGKDAEEEQAKRYELSRFE